MEVAAIINNSRNGERMSNDIKPSIMSPDELFEHVNFIINYHEELRKLYGDVIAEFFFHYINDQLLLHRQALSVPMSS